MKSSAVRFWLIFATILVAIYASFVFWRGNHAESEAAAIHVVQRSAPLAAEPAREPVTDFTLTDQFGKPFDSGSLRGKVWVASFFFVNCPAKCWQQNQALAALQQTSPDSQARYVSISCDPENDTPQALDKYAQHFHADPARWTFLTGDLGLICRIGKDMFKISVEKAGHTDRACVVDRQGRVRGSFRLTEPDQVELLRQLVAVVETEPAPAAPSDESTAEAHASTSASTTTAAPSAPPSSSVP